jgi:hypothetical protein
MHTAVRGYNETKQVGVQKRVLRTGEQIMVKEPLSLDYAATHVG